jgi:hypothetical protein
VFRFEHQSAVLEVVQVVDYLAPVDVPDSLDFFSLQYTGNYIDDQLCVTNRSPCLFSFVPILGGFGNHLFNSAQQSFDFGKIHCFAIHARRPVFEDPGWRKIVLRSNHTKMSHDLLLDNVVQGICQPFGYVDLQQRWHLVHIRFNDSDGYDFSGIEAVLTVYILVGAPKPWV